MKRNEREMMEEDKYLGIGKKKEVIKKKGVGKQLNQATQEKSGQMREKDRLRKAKRQKEG